MTTKPPPDSDDPLLRPASNEGWDDAPTAPDPKPAAPPAAPSVSPVPVVSPVPSASPAPSVSPVPSVAPPSPPTPSSAKLTPADEPLLPRTFHENDLRAAVGVSPLADTAAKTTQSGSPTEHTDDDSDDAPPRRRRSRKLVAAFAIAITLGLTGGVVALFGALNRDRYSLSCEAERAVPHQGRGFPPWGTRPIDGDAWRPLKINPETPCQPFESHDPVGLERRFLSMILDQANALLSAREVTRADDAEALLNQGLLLTRPPERETEKLAVERAERRKDIERLLGDVTYWRASARLRDALSALSEAAKQFESAATQQPRHVSDASAWATYARRLAQELRAGPTGSGTPIGIPSPGSPSSAPSTTGPGSNPSGSPSSGSPSSGSPSPPGSSSSTNPPAPGASLAPSSTRPLAPPGVALPVERESPTPPPAAPPDAGAPSGGVLL
jgi:hypothetical protein